MWWFISIGGLLACWVLYDVTQRSHAIVRNFPVVGHFRYWLESIGPEVRQYIVTNNEEERPFNRDQRRWVYASSKKENNYFGFGTDSDLENKTHQLIINHSAFPKEEPLPGSAEYDPAYNIPCAKVLGKARNRTHAFRPNSIINVSGMSYGSLSTNAIIALNEGSALCGCLHNTGEGGVSPYHSHGGDLVWQIGTGYFGCRTKAGQFDWARFKDVVDQHPVKCIEIKLSQGAKPSRGGVLPKAKISREIASIRGISMEQDCISPSAHSTFHDVDSMLDFVEKLADVSGLPVGIKSAVGQMDFWHELVKQMESKTRGVDFITIDGGEGGTGAAPLVFTDFVSLPFKTGFSRIFPLFAQHQLAEDIVFIGSGKLGFPESALTAISLGCDMVAVGREAMLAMGCIQAQRCHTDHCPAGVATQNKWLMRGLDPHIKSVRVANYITSLRKEIMYVTWACGKTHPALIEEDHLEILDANLNGQSVRQYFGYSSELSGLSMTDRSVLIEKNAA